MQHCGHSAREAHGVTLVDRQSEKGAERRITRSRIDPGVKPPILRVQEKHGRNLLCGGGRWSLPVHRTDISLYVLCAYVSTLSVVFPVLPANLSVSACVERAQHFSVWVAGICPSIARALPSLYLCVCLAAKPTVISVCGKREEPSFSAEGLPAERSEEPIYLGGYL